MIMIQHVHGFLSLFTGRGPDKIVFVVVFKDNSVIIFLIIIIIFLIIQQL